MSHGAGGLYGPDWFIVQPWHAPDGQVASLRKAGRTVIEIDARPWNGEAKDVRYGQRREALLERVRRVLYARRVR